jgi:hypothetical protein
MIKFGYSTDQCSSTNSGIRFGALCLSVAFRTYVPASRRSLRSLVFIGKCRTTKQKTIEPVGILTPDFECQAVKDLCSNFIGNVKIIVVWFVSKFTTFYRTRTFIATFCKNQSFLHF